ncbi:hypothetical protein, partial [Staphylococcus aureus]
IKVEDINKEMFKRQ